MCFPASSWAASTKAAVKKRTVLLLLGTLCLLAALGLTIWNLWTADRAQAAAAAAVQQLEPLIPAPAQQEPAKTTDAPAAEPEEPDIPDYLLNPGMAMPVVMVDGVAYIGVLEIPALELTLPVTGEWSYDRLKIALCRYAGSAYLDNLAIMGHNYPAFFKNLGDLRPGDLLFFWNSGRTRIYHTGIWLGGGKYIHASSSAGQVVVSGWSDWAKNSFSHGKRVY